MICKNTNTYSFIKTRLDERGQFIKKGGVSLLTRIERDILNQGREIILHNRMIYPFVFSEVLGAIYVKRKRKDMAFTELEKKWFLSLSEEISVSLKIFNLYREEKKMMINYIKNLTRVLDQYVPTSYLHIKSIFNLIRAMGKEMRLSPSEIKSLEYSCLLHDAGKLDLPSQLLKKQTSLTDEEFMMIKKHPRKGVEMIKDLEILKPVIPIILHHHERFDGGGYPSRLKKEQIPLGARILAVLDAFDAMYFGRPYRRKKKLKEIERELRMNTGRQFDPKIVNVFLRVLKGKKIRKYLRYCT